MNALLCTCWRCPYAMRARKALLQADVALDAFEIVLRDKPAEMLALWPKGGGPAHKAPLLALLTACDGPFKHHLDHTKYPERLATSPSSRLCTSSRRWTPSGGINSPALTQGLAERVGVASRMIQETLDHA